MSRSRVFRRVVVRCLGVSALWPLAAPASISSSGDATVLPPPGAPLPSYLFAGRIGIGSLSINGSTPAGFPAIYLGANNPLGAAVPSSQGTLSLSGATVSLGPVLGNGPGTAILSVTGSSNVTSSSLSLIGAASTFTLTDSTFNTGNFLTSLNLGATLTATNSVCRTSLSMSGGARAIFFNSFLGDAVNFASLNVNVGSTATAAGMLSFGGNSQVSVKDVIIGVAVSGPSVPATLSVLNSTFTANRLFIGDGDSLFDPVEGTGAVTIENSTLALRDSLDVGKLAPARLELKGSASATAPRVFVGGFDPRTDDRNLILSGTSSLTVGTSIEIRGGNLLPGAGTTLTSNGTTQVGTLSTYLGELTVSGGFFDSVGALTVGAGGMGVLGLQDPQAVRPAPALILRANVVTVGSGSTGDGEMLMRDGVAAQLNGDAIVGQGGGRGTLEVALHAQLTTGALRIGNGGVGILKVLTGGKLTTANGRVDSSAGLSEVSRASIEGAGSQWTVADLKVSGQPLGNSVVQVSTGGTLATNSAQLGFFAANGVVTIDGGTWTNAAYLEIGSGFGGSALLDHAGILTTDSLLLGNPTQPGSVSGQLDLRGGASVTVANGFSLGRERNTTPGQGGSGQLTIEAATLTTSGGAFLGSTAYGPSVLTENTVRIGAGGLWTSNGGLIIGDGTLGEAELTVEAGGTLTNSTGTTLARGAFGELAVAGTISSADNLVIGERGVGRFYVLPGASVATADVYLGQDAGSLGQVQVTSSYGPSFSIPWTITGQLVVARNGSAYFGLAAGGVSRVSGPVVVSDGVPTSNGLIELIEGSDFRTADTLQIGRTGIGALKVLGGSYAESHGPASVGLFAGSNGAAQLDGQTAGGVRSTWNNLDGALGVGESGTGRLDIVAGGRLLSLGGSLGANAGGIGAAYVNTGGDWTTTDLLVGGEGRGDLILAGASGTGTVTSTGGVVGRSSTGVGQVSLTGAGAAWVLTGDLTMGESGRATVILADGASIRSNATVTVGRDTGSHGVLTFTNGAYLNTLGPMRLGGGDNRIALTSGASLGALDFSLDSGGTIPAKAAGNALTVADPTTFLTTGNFFTGGASSNNFAILTGGVIYASQAALGGLGFGGNPALLNNTGVVSGAGARLDVKGTLDIGSQIPGRLNVELAGVALSTAARVGLFADGGFFLRSGGRWSGSTLEVYATPLFASLLDISDGARVTVAGPVVVGRHTGVYRADYGSVLNVSGTGVAASPPEVSAASVVIGGEANGMAALIGRATLAAATVTVGGHGQLSVSDGIVAGALAVESGGFVSLTDAGSLRAPQRASVRLPTRGAASSAPRPAGGAAAGALLVTGSLTIEAGGTVRATGNATLTVQGCVTNHGLLVLAGGASFSAPGGCFTNDGTIDLITAGNFDPGPGFVNNGILLDSSVVKVKSAVRSGGNVTVKIDGYTGHTYRLQRSLDLAGQTFVDIGTAQAGATGAELIFNDPGATGVRGFYRIVVEP